MKDRHHLLAGAIVGYGVMKGFYQCGSPSGLSADSIQTATALLTGATAFFSIIPNFDNAYGMEGTGGFLGSSIGTLVFKIQEVSDARGALHSLWGLVLTPLILFGFTGFKWSAVLYCSFFAILTHLIMDMLTPFGICWLPLPTWEWDRSPVIHSLATLPGVRNPKRKYVSLAKVKQTGFGAFFTTVIISVIMSNVAYFSVIFCRNAIQFIANIFS